MLVQLLFDLFGNLVHAIYAGLLGLIPDPPAWLLEHAAEAHTVYQVVQGFETWVPVSLAFTVAVAVSTAWAMGLVIGFARVVVSYVTLGGGAT